MGAGFVALAGELAVGSASGVYDVEVGDLAGAESFAVAEGCDVFVGVG